VPEKIPPWPARWLQTVGIPSTLFEELSTGTAKSVTVSSSYVLQGGAAEARVLSAHWSDSCPGRLGAKSFDARVCWLADHQLESRAGPEGPGKMAVSTGPRAWLVPP